MPLIPDYSNTNTTPGLVLGGKVMPQHAEMMTLAEGEVKAAMESPNPAISRLLRLSRLVLGPYATNNHFQNDGSNEELEQMAAEQRELQQQDKEQAEAWAEYERETSNTAQARCGYCGRRLRARVRPEFVAVPILTVATSRGSDLPKGTDYHRPRRLIHRTVR